MLAGGVMCAAFRWPQFRKWIALAGVALIVVVLYWNYQNDLYRDWWKDDRGVQFIDTYHRSGKLVERSWHDYENKTSGRGGMAGDATPKPHGRWTYDAYGGKFESLDVYYWYGEKISEGEWHLRNKN